MEDIKETNKENLYIPFNLVSNKSKLKDELNTLDTIINSCIEEDLGKQPDLITAKLLCIQNIPITKVIFEDEDIKIFADYLRKIADEVEEIGYMGMKKDEKDEIEND